MKPFKTLFLFILLAGVLTTCKKYPDSTCRWGRGNEKVLAGKDKEDGKWWVLESIYIDNNDSTQQFLTNHNYVYYLKFIRKMQDPSGEKILFAADISNNLSPFGNTPSGLSVWSFDRNENISTENFLFLPNTSGNWQYQNQTWEVRNLCDDKFWFKFDYNGKTYYFKYNATE